MMSRTIFAGAILAVVLTVGAARPMPPRGPDGKTWCESSRLYEECAVEGEKEWIDTIARPHMIQVQQAGFLNPDNGRIFRRAFHPTNQGCYRAYFDVVASGEGRIGPLFSQAHKRFDAFVRFSNGHPFLGGGDVGPDFRGFALKVLGVPGRKLRNHQATTQDFLMLNAPVLPLEDAVGTMDFFNKTLPPGSTWDLVKYMATSSLSVKAWMIKYLIRNPLSLRTETFFSGTPYKFGHKAMKFFVEPCEGTARGSLFRSFASDKFRVDMETNLKRANVCYDFYVQIQVSVEATPIENHHKVWEPRDSPPLRVGRVVIPRRGSTENEDYCESLQFSPFNSVAEYKPIGSTNRLREEVYRTSARMRHAAEEP